LVVALAVAADASPIVAAPPCPVGMAHRGNAFFGGPAENSLGAFAASFGAGAEWVETDMQFTADGVPVIMHDPTVDRTTNGTGPVTAMTAAQFTALTLDDGQHPPTLDQVLDLLEGKPARHVFLEVKSVLPPTQERVVLDKLRGLESAVYLDAFALALPTLRRLKAIDPALNISLTSEEAVLPVPEGLDGENLEVSRITPALVARLHRQGASVRAWLPDNPTTWREMRLAGVDAVTTNKARAYGQWKAGQCRDLHRATPGELVANQGLEADLSGWTGTATTRSVNERVRGGVEGGYALRSVNGSTAPGKVGFTSKPDILDGTSRATRAGETYTASLWVKPDAAGQKISIYLQESSRSGAVRGSATATITAAGTDWQPLSGTYTAVASGDSLAFHVFVTNAPPGGGFSADQLSFAPST
jgi:glycerophosphoryl diester phosphodiesterase